MTKIEVLPTPTYITDVSAFRRNITTFRDALQSVYPNSSVAYSYKTNYYDKFLRAAYSEKALAEVVSCQEFQMALEQQVSLRDIVYNGVIPDKEHKFLVATSGGVVNFDNVAELKDFHEFCKRASIHCNVGVRLNFDLGIDYVSRFGVDVNSKSEMDWLLDESLHPYLTIDKLHCHFSKARGLPEFQRRVSIMAHFAKMLNASTIDIGGGMFGVLSAEFKEQFTEYVPPLTEYANIIGDEMNRQFPNGNVRLIVEGGTAFVTNAMHLLTTMLNVKKVQGHNYITCDCRSEDVGWCACYKRPVVKSLCYGAPLVVGAILGCECTETDIIRREWHGAAINGGKLLIHDIGAYSSNLVNDFIAPGCRTFIDASMIDWHIDCLGFSICPPV